MYKPVDLTHTQIFTFKTWAPGQLDAKAVYKSSLQQTLRKNPLIWNYTLAFLPKGGSPQYP